jgi:hypothetical protein
MGHTGYKTPINTARSRCRTPGTEYGTDIRSDAINLSVDLPIHMLNKDDEPNLTMDLHRAILPVIEKLFQDRWRLLAGQLNPRMGAQRMPKNWSDL